MVSRLQKWLAAPQFADENKTRVAGLLNFMLLAGVVVTVVSSLILLFAAPQSLPNLLISATAIAIYTGGLFAVRRGFVKPTSHLFIWVVWALLTAANVIQGGTHSPTFSGSYLLVVLIAGLLLGSQAALIFAGLSILTGLGLLSAQTSGWLPPPLSPVTPISQWVAQVTFLIVVGLLLFLAVKAIEEAQRRAHSEVGERIQAEENFRNLLEFAPDAMLVANHKGEIMLVNQQAKQLFGYTRHELVGLSVEALLPARFRSGHQAHRTRYLTAPGARSMGGADMKLFGLGKDGREIPVEIRLNTIMTGTETLILCAIRDITERVVQQRALRENEERFRSLYEDAPIAYLSVGIDGRIQQCNQKAIHLLGHQAAADLIGKYVIDLYADTPQGKPQASQILQRLKADQPIQNEKLQMHRADGTPFWVSLTVNAIRDAGGQVIASRSIIVDITDRVESEEKTRHQNQGLTTLNAITTATTSTLELSEILNLALEQAMSLTGLEGGTICLIPPDKNVLHLAVERQASQEMIMDLTQNQVQIGDCLCGDAAISQQPVILWTDASSSSLAREASRDEGINFHGAFPLVVQKRSIGVLCVFTRTDKRPTQHSMDILQIACDQIAIAIENARLYDQSRQFNRELEARIADATAKIERRADELSALYTVSRSLVASLDLETLLPVIARQVTEALKADRCVIFLYDEKSDKLQVRAVYGYLAKEISSSNYRPGQEIVDHAYMSEKTQYVADMNLVALPQDDGIRSVLVVPVALPNAGPLGVLSITSLKPRAFSLGRRQLLETMASQTAIAIQNAHLYEAAQEADRLKSAFLATMSHELRTPLNSIIGFTGILLQALAGPLNAEQEKQLGMVRESAHHLLALINDVLDISKIEAGQMEIHCTPFDMCQAIEESIKALTVEAERKSLIIETQVALDVGRIDSDRRRVEQILINLISNAVKFTETGTIQIACRRHGDRLVTSVKDTGPGIKPEDMGDLFKPFRQIDTGFDRRYEGTGLGLSICQRLVTILGGEIWVESEWGTGSTFTFTLPL